MTIQPASDAGELEHSLTFWQAFLSKESFSSTFQAHGGKVQALEPDFLDLKAVSDLSQAV